MKLVFSLFIISSFLILGCQQDNPSKTKEQIGPINYDDRLASLGLSLEAPIKPIANYVHIVQVDNLLFLAGKGPKQANGQYIKGTLGDDLTTEEGYLAAKRVAELQLAVLKDHLGDLNKVKQIVKVTGLVRSTDNFGEQPEVMNGFSDTLVAVFGERGKHARAAMGTNALPRNICLEIEMIVEIY